LIASSLLAAALFSLAAASPGATAPGAVVATVNGEQIAEADLERALRTAPPGTTRESVVQGLVQQALIAQEARRRKVGDTAAYRALVRRWREDKAIGLIGVDELRRIVGRNKPKPYKEFYPQAAAAFAGLAEADRMALEKAVDERITALRGKAGVMIDSAGLRRYTVVGEIPPATARGIVAARTSWGDITLEEILAEEPQSLGHIGQTAADILKMWQQIAAEIAARRNVLDVAEKAGFFAVGGVKEEEALALRQLLGLAYLESHFAKQLTTDLVRERIDREIPGWTATFGLTVDAVDMTPASRLDVEEVLPPWRQGGTLPAKAHREKTTLERIWVTLTAEQKRVVMDQPWRGEVPPLRGGNGYLLLRLDAGTPPDQMPTLRALAESLLREDLRASLVKELSAKANITRH
jgi:hypothetical protein